MAKNSLMAALFSSLLGIGGSVMAANPPIYSSPKTVPDVELRQVQAIFGDRLETSKGELKLLLLAVAMDHTSPNSPHLEEKIGIPYIVSSGPKHWVSRLQKGERSVEVLVNNALLLLYTKETIPGSQTMARDLLRAAASKGYWPADYYVAEIQLQESLVKDEQQFSLRTNSIVDFQQKEIARDTFTRLSRCAEIGFAPCQYRVGFWLLAEERKRNDGVNALRQAVKTTLQDPRYKGLLESSVTSAAIMIAHYYKIAGLTTAERDGYAKLGMSFAW